MVKKKKNFEKSKDLINFNDEITKIPEVKKTLDADLSISCKRQKKQTEKIADVHSDKQDANMIIVEITSEQWKSNAEKKSYLDEKKIREEDFENYLEDFFL